MTGTRMAPVLDPLVERFYRITLAGCWPAGRSSVDAGYGDRVMFGSDQIIWPGLIEAAGRGAYRLGYLEEGRGFWEANLRSVVWMSGAIFAGQMAVRFLPPMAWLSRDLRNAMQAHCGVFRNHDLLSAGVAKVLELADRHKIAVVGYEAGVGSSGG